MLTDSANAPEASASLDLDATQEQLAGKSALEIVKWAAENFEDGLVMSSSFGAQAEVMLHLCTRIVPDIPVIWVDTGYLFPETYQWAEQLAEKYTLNLKVYQSPVSPARMEATHGRPWEDPSVEGLNQYDQLRKVEPMRRALRELKAAAWLTGVRAKQTSARASMRAVEWHPGNGVYAVRPLLEWHTRDVYKYVMENGLDYHPLYAKGYASIGDMHSTRPVTAGEDERAGRFHGLKSECGIHLPESPGENQSMDSAGL